MSDDSEKEFEPIAGHFVDLMAADMNPPEFIVKDVLVPGLMFLIGPPKVVYKSTITVGLASLINTGKCDAFPPEWAPRRQGTTMMFSYEADAGELRYTAEKGLGQKWPPDEGVLVCEDPSSYRLDEDGATGQMLAWLDDRRPTLVVLDPLANFHNLDEKDAGQMLTILSPLRKWAKKNDACFLIVHHARKLQDDSRRYQPSDARGTSALFGMADGLLTLSPEKTPLSVYIDAQFKRAPPWQKSIELGAWDNLGKRGTEALRTIDHLIIQAVKGGKETTEELVAHLNLKRPVLVGRLVVLVKNGHLKHDAEDGTYEVAR